MAWSSNTILSGKLQFKHSFVDNQLHGTALDYYENGVLKSKVNFELGVQNGPDQTFSEVASLLKKAPFKMASVMASIRYTSLTQTRLLWKQTLSVVT